MVLKMKAKVTVEIEAGVTSQIITYEAEDGKCFNAVECYEPMPAFNNAILLLGAAADVLAGSSVGQIVMAAFSACKVQLTRQAVNEGSVALVDEKDAPF